MDYRIESIRFFGLQSVEEKNELKKQYGSFEQAWKGAENTALMAGKVSFPCEIVKREKSIMLGQPLNRNEMRLVAIYRIVGE